MKLLIAAAANTTITRLKDETVEEKRARKQAVKKERQVWVLILWYAQF